MFINRRINKHIWVYPLNGILYKNKIFKKLQISHQYKLISKILYNCVTV